MRKNVMSMSESMSSVDNAKWEWKQDRKNLQRNKAIMRRCTKGKQ